MAATDPSFPSPADGTFDGPLAAMVVLLVAVAVGAVLWPIVRALLPRTPADEVAPDVADPEARDTVEPRRSRSQRTRDVADRLRQLQRDREAGLLTDAEYDVRRRALLDDL